MRLFHRKGAKIRKGTWGLLTEATDFSAKAPRAQRYAKVLGVSRLKQLISAQRHQERKVNKAPSARLGLAVAIALLWLVLFHFSLALADDPQGQGTTTKMRGELPRHRIALTASDDGPFFTLEDLAEYTPVPRTPPHK